jgi:predicted O-methyltransferase YrrM
LAVAGIRKSNPMKIQEIQLEEFNERFGPASVVGGLDGPYTPLRDFRILAGLLVRYDCKRILEIGTALGHTTANLTQFSRDDALIYTMGNSQEIQVDLAREQHGEIPSADRFGQHANHFGKIHKVFFIQADSTIYDFNRLGPLDFVFIDGGHHYEAVSSDSVKSYRACRPGGVITWHDFYARGSWVRVWEAVEDLPLSETAYCVAGTQVGFCIKDNG